MTERREASALLAGCHEPWRQQRPERALLTRQDWQQLLPLVAPMQAQRPDVALTAVLTDQVASARHPPNVLAWRLWRLLRTSPQQQKSHRQKPPPRHAQPECLEEPQDRHQYRDAVRTTGGPAVARAALTMVGVHPFGRTLERVNGRTSERVDKNQAGNVGTPPAHYFPH